MRVCPYSLDMRRQGMTSVDDGEGGPYSLNMRHERLTSADDGKSGPYSLDIQRYCLSCCIVSVDLVKLN